MGRQQALDIYDRLFWQPLKLDEVIKLSPALASRLYTIGVNCGAGRAGEYLQRWLNGLNRRQKDYADIKADGLIGDATLTALKAFYAKRGDKGLENLQKALACSQGHNYLALVERREKDEEFLNGWVGERV